MSHDPQEISFVRDDGKLSLRAQRKAATDRGITKIYDDWALLIKQRRPGLGDVIVVRRLYLVADPKRAKAKGGIRQSLISRMAEAEAAGAVIFELDTGRSTAKVAEKYAMLSDALDVLAYSRARSKRIGRPPLQFTDDQKTIMRMHWESRNHQTNGEALAAMAAHGIKTNAQALIKLFGPSGRKPGTTGPRPPKIAKRTKRK